MAAEGRNLIDAVSVLRSFWEESEAFKKELWEVLRDQGPSQSPLKFVEEIEDAAE